MSAESLRFMMGGALKRAATGSKVTVERTEMATVITKDTAPELKDHLTDEVLELDEEYQYLNLTTGKRGIVGTRYEKYGVGEDGNADTTNVIESITKESYEGLSTEKQGDYTEKAYTFEAAAGDMVRFFWQEEREEEDSAMEITISPSTFPGTYKFVGETFIRSEKDGRDVAYQFIIPKAKVSSEVTLTMEADGDPATFEMTLNVLRSQTNNGYEMFKFVRY